MRIAAIDQGTTSTRVLIADGSETRLLHSVEHSQNFPHQGWVEHDPEQLINNITTCLDAVDTVGTVDCIGIGNQGESCLAWDAQTKQAITPVIVWQDNRTAEAIEKYKVEGAEALTLERAGLPLDPYFSASKLGWIIENSKEAKERLKAGRLRLGTTDAFFLDRLSGTFATDITTASRTSLMNLATASWDEDLCRLFGVPIDALPPIYPTVSNFGSVSLGGRDIPITASVVDQQAALYGHGCRTTGDAKLTFGTGAFALAVTGNQIIQASEEGLLPTVAWKIKDDAPIYALDGGVYNAGSAVNWARSLGLFSSFNEIDAFDASPAIQRGLAFVSALSGLACPYWDRSAAGLWIGLSLDTSSKDMMQALLEGIAFRAAEVIEAMNGHVPIGNTLSVDGGMSANSYFCQFLANLLGREIIVQDMPELTALGVAMFAADGSINVIPTNETAKHYEPKQVLHDWKERFRDAVNRSRNWR